MLRHASTTNGKKGKKGARKSTKQTIMDAAQATLNGVCKSNCNEIKQHLASTCERRKSVVENMT